ncbi:citrate synthase/methylcitrate synthase [Pigmentiphaga sp. CHJ604]|uniref:citrate synthase/methylcitrate synthase n=1 Tax=Pigmentiphaga sp. CHJ604 TaxID=3081984 RepID=UPI0030CA6FAF
MMTIGLDDVIAAETVLSDVDGLQGRLVMRGRSLDDLAGHAGYEAVMALLFDGFFERAPASWQAALGAARREVFEHLSFADPALVAQEPIDAMRALTARIADGDGPATALRLVAAPAVFTAGLVRLRKGLRPIPPDASLGHAADILRMAGLPAEPLQARALDTYLVTVADHGLNASTFASRVVASTRAGLVSSVLAAISALKGPLHGGAPGPVLDMLDAIERADHARAWLEAALDRGDRLMGFGHRVYRVRDPRADALKSALGPLLQDGRADRERAALAQAIEAAALDTLRRRKPGRTLETNVEFYTALLLDALGFQRDTFTCVFAMGRVAGWIAHAREQASTGRLIRPQSRYVGPPVGEAQER